MKFVKLIMVLSVMGLWLAAVNHCSLENIPALKFLACGEPGEAQTHQDNDCEKDSCATVEKAGYKTERARIEVAAPMVLLATILTPLTTKDVLDFLPAGVIPALVPELPVGWQFSYRTAAPPRAPSFLS